MTRDQRTETRNAGYQNAVASHTKQSPARRRGGLERGIRVLLVMLIVLVVVVLPAAAWAGYTVYMQEGAYPGVRVAGIEVGGKNEAQIRELLDVHTGALLAAKTLPVTVDEAERLITAADVGAAYDADTAAKDALAYCRSGSLFIRFLQVTECRVSGHDIELAYTWQPERLEGIARELSEAADSAFVESAVEVSEEAVLVELGHEGRSLDASELAAALKARFEAEDFSPLRRETQVTQPRAIDWARVKTNVDSPAVDAARDPADPLLETIEAEAPGVELDLAAVNRALSAPGAGPYASRYTIPLNLVEPKVTREMLLAELYRDELIYAETSLNVGNKNRTSNVRLACEFVDGTVLGVGEEFSFNKVVGKRTYDRGFKDATIFVSGEMVDDVGGGICQVSSTLYMAAVRSDLEIAERRNHRFTVAYTPLGEDATVAYGSVDFRFVNNTDYPIRIEVKLDGSQVKVRFIGTKTENKTVEIVTKTLEKIPFQEVEEADETLAPGTRKVKASGQNGYKTESYRVVYIDGVEVSRKLENRSNYARFDKVILVGPLQTATTPPEDPAQTTAPGQTTGSGGQPPAWLGN